MHVSLNFIFKYCAYFTAILIILVLCFLALCSSLFLQLLLFPYPVHLLSSVFRAYPTSLANSMSAVLFICFRPHFDCLFSCYYSVVVYTSPFSLNFCSFSFPCFDISNVLCTPTLSQCTCSSSFFILLYYTPFFRLSSSVQQFSFFLC